ncbi:hypothetical protein GGR92_003663 [Spirosoma lacussanchae]|uniref:hypothetical protein n=1 Tax=Spirosoma lacussanchae TaxID=1884249 RepID=UPI001107F3EC|nr:hypothetical protein [Spirosoma lacussanchae]
MSAPDDSYLKALIDTNLADSPPGQPRSIKPAILRFTLKTLIDWTKTAINGATNAWLRVGDNQPTGVSTDTIYHRGKVIAGRMTDDGSGAFIQAPSARFEAVNGIPGPFAAITSVGESTLPGTRYYAFTELPASAQGTFDFIDISLTAKPWDNSSGKHLHLEMYAANRGTFRYEYTVQGEQDGVGIVAYQQPDGRTIFYVVSDNNFRSFVVTINRHQQATLYGNFVYSANPTGTLVFSSLNTTAYKPLTIIRSRFTKFNVGNSDSAYPAETLNEPGSSQLTLAANWISGSSDLGLVNSNLAGGGFSFWQQTGAAAKKLLAWLTQDGNLGLGTLTPGERLHVVGSGYFTESVKFPSTLLNRKVILYDLNGNDHQYYGMGVTNVGYRYQISSVDGAHVFYAGTSPTTSAELMRITGSGRVGIGMAAPAYTLDVGSSNPSSGIIAQFTNTATSNGTGAIMQIHQGGIAIWRYGIPAGADAFVIYGWGGGSFPEYLRISGDGQMRVNGSISGKYATSNVNPAPADLADGYWRVQRNSSTGEVRMWVNVGGTIKSVLFS